MIALLAACFNELQYATGPLSYNSSVGNEQHSMANSSIPVKFRFCMQIIINHTLTKIGTAQSLLGFVFCSEIFSFGFTVVALSDSDSVCSSEHII